MSKDLQNRLIGFADICIQLRKSLLNCYEGEHLGKQLIRSSTSAALNLGEARSAESQRDFIHKMSIILKELRESNINLTILSNNNLSRNPAFPEKAIDESNQLIEIFVVSIKRSKSRKNNL